jgi:hypothetical protein
VLLPVIVCVVLMTALLPVVLCTAPVSQPLDHRRHPTVQRSHGVLLPPPPLRLLVVRRAVMSVDLAPLLLVVLVLVLVLAVVLAVVQVPLVEAMVAVVLLRVQALGQGLRLLVLLPLLPLHQRRRLSLLLLRGREWGGG